MVGIVVRSVKNEDMDRDARDKMMFSSGAWFADFLLSSCFSFIF